MKNPSANSSAQGVGAKVVAMPASRQPQTAVPSAGSMGEVEAAVREQCAAADARGDNQAGIKAAAIKLAQLIDDPDAKGQAGGNIAKLQKLLDSLGRPKRKMKGQNTLAVVSTMAGRKQVREAK